MAATYSSENLSMVEEASGMVPGYSGHQPGSLGVCGQRQSAATAHMKNMHAVCSTAQTKQCTTWAQYDRRPELSRDTKNYLFAENTKSEDTLFLQFPRRAKDVDVRSL